MKTELKIEEKRDALVNYFMNERANFERLAHDAAGLRRMNIYLTIGNSLSKQANYILTEANNSYVEKLYRDTLE